MYENTKLSIGKPNSKLLYVYNHDKSILHYTAVSALSFLKEVKISQSTLTSHLASGKALVGKFTLSRELYPGVENQLIDITDLSQLIAEGKKEQNIVRLTNPETRQKMLDSNPQKVSITLIDIQTGKEYSFVSLAKASKFTRSFASNNFRYIGINKLSYLKSGESYKGFLVKK